MASQGRGLYEVLVTEALASQLQNLDARLYARNDGLRPAEAADRIARVVRRVREAPES